MAMKKIMIDQVPIMVYSFLRLYGEVVPERFSYVIKAYREPCTIDTKKSERLSMDFEEHVIVGKNVLFCSNYYNNRSYQLPSSAYLLCLPSSKLRNGKIGGNCRFDGFSNEEIAQVLFVQDNGTLTSLLANDYELTEIIEILKIININNYCTVEQASEIAKILAVFFDTAISLY